MHKLYDFMEARERLSTITVKTKLLHSDVFSDECGNDVYIKPENLQITGSFKVRGAYNKIAKLTEEEKALFEEKIKLAKCKNMSHFIRKCVLEKEIY